MDLVDKLDFVDDEQTFDVVHPVHNVYFVHKNLGSKAVFTAVEGNPGDGSPVLRDMKQYLVVKIAKQLGSLIEMIPVAGLFPLEAAEQFVRNAGADEPESLFLIQQVGNA